MKITHQNIDKWLFDYCEGNLSSSDKKQLFSFLEENPEYREDLDAWKDSFLTREPAPVFVGADALMVSETAYTWKNVVAVCALLLLIGGGAGYMMMNYDEQAELNAAAGNGSVFTGNTAVNQSPFNTQTKAPFSTFNNKKRDALPSSHTPGTLPRIHSPNLVNNSASQTSHSSISNASLNFQAANTANSESSEFNTSGQVFAKNQISEDLRKQSQNAENIFVQNTENEELKEKMGDAQIKPREEPYLPWQLTRISDLNPDYLAGLPKRDYGKTLVITDKFNYNAPKGLTLTNTYEHELLQPLLFSLQQNASYSGGYRQLEGMLGTRARWIGTEHEAFDLVAGFQDYKRKWKSAYGMYVQYTSYAGGDINTTTANAFFSPKIKMDRYTWIEPSVNVSYSFLRVSPSMFNQDHRLELFPGQPYSTQMGVVKGNQGYFDVSASVQLQARRMYASLGLSHLAQPNITILNNETSNPYRMPAGIDLTLGTDMQSKRVEEFILSPQIGFVAQGIYHRTWAGARVRYKNKYAAASATPKGEVFAMAGIRTKIGSFAYKFDFTESVLMEKKVMSHGITASLYLRSFNNRIHPILDHGLGKEQ